MLRVLDFWHEGLQLATSCCSSSICHKDGVTQFSALRINGRACNAFRVCRARAATCGLKSAIDIFTPWLHSLRAMNSLHGSLNSSQSIFSPGRYNWIYCTVYIAANLVPVYVDCIPIVTTIQILVIFYDSTKLNLYQGRSTHSGRTVFFARHRFAHAQIILFAKLDVG